MSRLVTIIATLSIVWFISSAAIAQETGPSKRTDNKPKANKIDIEKNTEGRNKGRAEDRSGNRRKGRRVDDRHGNRQGGRHGGHNHWNFRPYFVAPYGPFPPYSPYPPYGGYYRQPPHWGGYYNPYFNNFGLYFRF